jgi:hypothetical protein
LKGRLTGSWPCGVAAAMSAPGPVPALPGSLRRSWWRRNRLSNRFFGPTRCRQCSIQPLPAGTWRDPVLRRAAPAPCARPPSASHRSAGDGTAEENLGWSCRTTPFPQYHTLLWQAAAASAVVPGGCKPRDDAKARAAVSHGTIARSARSSRPVDMSTSLSDGAG